MYNEEAGHLARMNVDVDAQELGITYKPVFVVYQN